MHGSVDLSPRMRADALGPVRPTRGHGPLVSDPDHDWDALLVAPDVQPQPKLREPVHRHTRPTAVALVAPVGVQRPGRVLL